ncbi:aminotransferase class I/II-fold pyridoxal phosphate-dependent enzyme [Dethiobacter alkaliphilus]|nr:aminotransferase class I/II-fold pyridoxal phosphate-dependent enzyme [Dethiobacter alkaliphilus]
MEQNQLPLWQALQKHTAKKQAWLHVPGHGGGPGLPPEVRERLGSVARYDLTELSGLDDLFAPREAIFQAQQLAAELWQAEESFFLVNGSSAGVQAMLMATCGRGDIVLVPRNAHGSFYHGLILCGATPRFLPVAEYKSVPLNITADALQQGFANYPEAKAVFLTSPNYYGVCADMAGIYEVVRQHNALLLLDEAHGAHLGFHSGFPQNRGHLADLRVQSWHKTLGALTPGAVLHRHGNGIDQERLRSSLQMVQTSSPPYPLLLSLDAARKQMALYGQQVAGEMLAQAQKLRRQLADSLPLLTPGDVEGLGFSLDLTRLTVLTGEMGCCGRQAAALLAGMGIDVEFGQPGHLLAIMGPGFCPPENVELAEQIIATLDKCTPGKKVPPLPEPQQAMAPGEAFFAPACFLTAAEAVGYISAGTVVSYPPGVPLLAPGEVVTPDVASYIKDACAAGISFRGLDNAGRLRLVKQEVGR